MAIIKAKQREYHARIPNETARDKELSLEAKGLLCVLLSLDENWTVYKKQLTEFSTNKYHSTSRAFDELIEKGYIFDRGRCRSKNGNLQENIYEVYAEKQPLEQIEPNRDFQDLDFPSPENPNVENHNLSNIYNNNKYNKKEIEVKSNDFTYMPGDLFEKMPEPEKKQSGRKKQFVPPTLEEVKAYFREKGYSEVVAEKAFDYYSTGNWIDSKGNKVSNWKQKMISTWFREENKEKGSQTSGKIKMVF